MDKTTQWVHVLVRWAIVSRRIVLDQLTILDGVALTSLVNLLVALCRMIVASLPSSSHRGDHKGRVPGFNTGNLTQPSVGLVGQFLWMPETGYPL